MAEAFRFATAGVALAAPADDTGPLHSKTFKKDVGYTVALRTAPVSLGVEATSRPARVTKWIDQMHLNALQILLSADFNSRWGLLSKIGEKWRELPKRWLTFHRKLRFCVTLFDKSSS